MKTYEYLIDRLIELRASKNLSQKDVAAMTGWSQAYISRLESKKTSPRLDTFCKYADSIGAVVDILN